ncbi:hypothetical protein ZIOFF_025063 [Zingiber officinale]|uniref:dUTP diphosphatase n=1 Tax=Zingiber officinale TaxID=94328 RepID=A0A8J5H083_ZINOF|nr:hypothetical protein ZIOFF_025063 [Zingiber officinale]
MAARIRSQEPPVTTLTRNTTEEQLPLFEDQVREYRQGQRRRYNNQRRLQRITRSITGQGPFNKTLEQQLDPQVQLRLSMQERASIVPAEVDRSLIQPKIFLQLQRSGMRFIHIGVIQVRVQILRRQEEGTLLLIIFRDNRWQGDQAIFATMEVDLTQGSQLVYVMPDTMLTISDFYRNIQISILARGYEGWQNSEANILITRGMVGRLSNTPNVGFAYGIQNVVDYLITHGPAKVSTRNMLDGRISIQFDNYQAAVTASQPHYNQRDEEIPSYEEEVQHQIIAVLLESLEILKVQRISSSAVLPKRKIEGFAGYDLAINREQFVPKKDKSLLTICIQIPKGTYARIAPRSSAALRGLIIMGGVVDEEYRGEVKIIAYNITNKYVYLQKHECIAQLILERIATPEVQEVPCLEITARGVQGFGSTTKLAYPSEAPLPKVFMQEQAHPECPGCAYCHDGTETAEPYEFYVTPTPGYIDDREYIEYTPMPQKKKQTTDEIFEEYQQFHQEYEWLQRRAMTSEDDPMEIAIS